MRNEVLGDIVAVAALSVTLIVLLWMPVLTA